MVVVKFISARQALRNTTWIFGPRLTKMCDCSLSNDSLSVFKNLVGTHEGTSPRDLDQTISPRLKPKSQLFLLSLFAPALCLLRVLLVRLLLALLASFAWASNAGGRNFGGNVANRFWGPRPERRE